jgi:anti-sigma-K factor RskA
MSTVGHYDQGDLALFAMQLLPLSEYEVMAAHIADCTYCRQELAQLQGDLASYAHTVELHSPPARVRERFANQIFREKKNVPVERPSADLPQAAQRMERKERGELQERIERIEAPKTQPGPRNITRGQSPLDLGSGRYPDEDGHTEAATPGPSKMFARAFAWAGWAAAAGLAITAGSLYHEREAQRATLAAQSGTIDRLSADAAGAKQLLETITDPSARQVTLSKTAVQAVPAVPQAHATYIASKGALIFLASNLEPIQPYKTYELWLIPADGRDPIPAGTFHPDARGNASVILPPLPKGIEAKQFGVTIEDDGGSQTPTMPIVLAGS